MSGLPGLWPLRSGGNRLGYPVTLTFPITITFSSTYSSRLRLPGRLPAVAANVCRIHILIPPHILSAAAVRGSQCCGVRRSPMVAEGRTRRTRVAQLRVFVALLSVSRAWGVGSDGLVAGTRLHKDMGMMGRGRGTGARGTGYRMAGFCVRTRTSTTPGLPFVCHTPDCGRCFHGDDHVLF